MLTCCQHLDEVTVAHLEVFPVNDCWNFVVKTHSVLYL